MAAITVGTTPVSVPGAQGSQVTIQNVSVNDVEIVEASDATFGDGLLIGAGQAYEPPRNWTKPIWLVSDTADCDVRLLAS